MNVYIVTGIECISVVFCREQALPGQRRFAEGRARMTADSLEEALFRL